MPSTLATATPMISSPPAVSIPALVWCAENAGSTTWSVAQPTAQAAPTVMVP